MDTPQPMMTPPEVAKIYRVKAATVINWIRTGQLRAINIARRGTVRPRFRISVDSLEDFDRSRTVDAIPPRRPRAPRLVPPPGMKMYV